MLRNERSLHSPFSCDIQTGSNQMLMLTNVGLHEFSSVGDEEGSLLTVPVISRPLTWSVSSSLGVMKSAGVFVPPSRLERWGHDRQRASKRGRFPCSDSGKCPRTAWMRRSLGDLPVVFIFPPSISLSVLAAILSASLSIHVPSVLLLPFIQPSISHSPSSLSFLNVSLKFPPFFLIITLLSPHFHFHLLVSPQLNFYEQ